MAEIEEKSKLQEFENKIQELEAQLDKETSEWNATVKHLASELKGDIKKIIEVQAEVLSYKQRAVDDSRKYSLQLHKANIPLKELKKTRFEFYSTKYPIQLKSDTPKKALIEADLAKIQYKSDLLATHIEFLHNTANDLDSLNYAVKNRIDLLNILGLS